ncbi:hypothetical protein ABT160_16130 [Streptomyces sp. NPDC001941]|uniref:hypothetical protein n=1 Tax=Streptomyces sp. NPDC001941 TaxID=3154659 RepID=UPI00332A2896
MAQPKNTTSMRRALRRDVPSAVGLLADPHDFTAMGRYRTFAFDDHDTYLRQVDGLLRSLATEGGHTAVALFDPEEYEEYCAGAGLDPDTPDSRSRFTAEVAASGACVTYRGQPIDHLVPQVVNQAVRHATWEYATVLLSGVGECAECGEDIGRAAFDQASHLMVALLEGAGPGIHHVVCSVPADDEHLIAVLHAETDASGPARLDTSEGAEFATVLAAGIALRSPGGVVLRTSTPEAPDVLRGWRLAHGRLEPLSEAEVFNAYCTDATTGDPLSPEPGVEYRAGYPVDPGTHWPRHH